jgi:hypothetical protein
MACRELLRDGRLPERVIEATRDWIQAEYARTGRARHALVIGLDRLPRLGGSPRGQTKLAKEAGLANNRMAI